MTRDFTVPGMSCQHCVNAVTSEVKQVQGVQYVKIDLNTKRVSVEANEQVSSDQIVAAINEAGYDEVVVLN